MRGHPSMRRLAKNNVEKVMVMKKSIVPTRSILSTLNNEGCIAISRDIYNLTAKIKKEELGNMHPTELLIMKMDEQQCKYSVVRNADGTLKRLFYAFPESIELARSFKSVILMDSTYKTNKFLIH